MLPFSKVKAFLSKVRSALTTGAKLTKKDALMVLDLLEKAMLREYIYTVAILEVIGDSKIPKKVIDKLSSLFSKAADRIIEGKEPFSPEEEKTLVALLAEGGLNKHQIAKLLHLFTAVRGKLLTDGFSQVFATAKERKKEEEVA